MALSCGISGAVTAIVQVHQTGILTTSVFTLPVLGATLGMPHLIGILVAAVVGFVTTFLFGYNDDMAKDEE